VVNVFLASFGPPSLEISDERRGTYRGNV